jgi:hypothetical protein
MECVKPRPVLRSPWRCHPPRSLPVSTATPPVLTAPSSSSASQTRQPPLAAGSACATRTRRPAHSFHAKPSVATPPPPAAYPALLPPTARWRQHHLAAPPPGRGRRPPELPSMVSGKIRPRQLRNPKIDPTHHPPPLAAINATTPAIRSMPRRRPPLHPLPLINSRWAGPRREAGWA